MEILFGKRKTLFSFENQSEQLISGALKPLQPYSGGTLKEAVQALSNLSGRCFSQIKNLNLKDPDQKREV